MEPSLLNRVRVERSAHELDLLQAAIDAWVQQREAADHDAQGRYVGRHKTQLATVRSLTAGAIEQIRTALRTVDTDGLESGDVYVQCRTLDQTVVWLHRLWTYVKEKFDQRDASASDARSLATRTAAAPSAICGELPAW